MAARCWPAAAPRAAHASASDQFALRKAARQRANRRWPGAMIGQTSSGFPRLARLRTSADYQAVFGDGKRFSSSCFRLHVQAQPAPAVARLGIAVSKRVDKLSPGRNRIKRVVREYFRQQRSGLASADFVVVAKPPAATASNQTLRSELEAVFKRASALPPAKPNGTMPTLEATDDRRHSTFPDPS